MTKKLFDPLPFEELAREVQREIPDCFPRPSFGSQLAAVSFDDDWEEEPSHFQVCESRRWTFVSRKNDPWSSVKLPTVPTIVAVIKTLGSGEQLGDFEAALDEEISGLPDDKIPRDPDFLTPSEHAKQLARRILLDLAHSFFSRSREIIPMPSLDAVTDGSIDIHWETERGELIINAPRDGEDSPISYYGHTPDRTAIIKGTLHPNEKHDFLMAWLLDR